MCLETRLVQELAITGAYLFFDLFFQADSFVARQCHTFFFVLSVVLLPLERLACSSLESRFSAKRTFISRSIHNARNLEVLIYGGEGLG